MKKIKSTSKIYSEEYAEIEKDYKVLLEKHKRGYVENDFGWYSKKPEIGIQELAKTYQNPNLLGYIQMSNQTTHASAYRFDRFLRSEFKDTLNSLETVVQNLVISLSLTNQILILHFGR